MMTNLIFKATIRNYAEAVNFLAGCETRALAYKTVVRDRGDGEHVDILHHGSIIATFYSGATPGGPMSQSHSVPVVRIRNAGWASRSTAERMHRIARAVMEATDTPKWVSVNTQGGRTNVVVGSGPTSGEGTATYRLGGAAFAIFADGEARVQVDVERHAA